MTKGHMRLRIGPAIFDIRSPFGGAIASLRHLYRDYPQGMPDEIYDFTVAALPTTPWRRWFRPSIRLQADFTVEEAVPVALRHALLAFEMGVNMQMALGYRRDIILHAASAARDDRAVVIVGDSGSGKSTLSALLSWSAGWRHCGDELALIGLAGDYSLTPYPRPIGLKNQSIPVMRERVSADRFGPRLEGTMKGTVQHLLPPVDAIQAMDRPARPALIVSPHFTAGASPEIRRMTQSEAYLRLSVASTNQLTLGEPGFDALIRLIRSVPAYDITYGTSEEGLQLVEKLWGDVE
jgi:HprK-related kinase A|tara:strand:+ start:19776 stop:20657 length:882 start_codon:yes stop_codon:yes gene_type:complete